MSQFNIVIPDNWEPNSKSGFNKWIDKIHNHVFKSKVKQSFQVSVDLRKIKMN